MQGNDQTLERLRRLKELKPVLTTPFPINKRYWRCPKTGLIVPKDPLENLKYRASLIEAAEHDGELQEQVLVACSKSYLFWVNTFAWTYHQFDVDPSTGEKIEAAYPDVPFITWDIQDEMFDALHWHVTHGKDILINKSRDMGASWCCLAYIHWEWLFHPGGEYLEMSRTKSYVDEYGNMKALLPKHDYINKWLPYWMMPPDVLPGGKNRKCMHIKNTLNGSTIDGESTTEHAASGDRRRIILLDEFAKVKYGKQMRNATGPASLCRFINSTVAGPGTEYSKWKGSGVDIFSLMYWDHPEKGAGRYAIQDPLTKKWEVRSPWFNIMEKELSRTEIAQEILAQDTESGDLFFELSNIETHTALFCCDPIYRMNVDFVKGVADDSLAEIIRTRRANSGILSPKVKATMHPKGKLRVWAELINNRLDQTYSYTIGCDISKGHGASNSVMSVLCNETKEKVAEWKDSHTPPYMMARIAVALSLWVGGSNHHGLPKLIWEKNGPGKDFGKQVVVVCHYPYYYLTPKSEGAVMEGVSKKYGWQSSKDNKRTLLREYDRALASGGIINHSFYGMAEAKTYIEYGNGTIGPAELVEDGDGALETHGDIVIADALCLRGCKKTKRDPGDTKIPETNRCAAWRKKNILAKKKRKKGGSWRIPFNHN